MFSPMVPIISLTVSSTVTFLPGYVMASSFDTSPLALAASEATFRTMSWNCSLRATKSVSELTSTTAPLLPLVSMPIRPSAATRPAFLAAFDRPFLRSQSTAASMSPLASVSAALQSIMPAPVFSRRSFTRLAEIVMARTLRWAARNTTPAGGRNSDSDAADVAIRLRSPRRASWPERPTPPSRSGP